MKHILRGALWAGFFAMMGHFLAGQVVAGSLEGPAIRFDYREVDFGKMPQKVSRDTTFIFTNLGDEPLRIIEVKTSCGCTAALPSEDIFKPGEKGTIDVTFDSKQFNGKVTKTVTVYSNDPGEPQSTLKVLADVEPTVRLSESRIELGVVQRGQNVTKSVRVAAKKEKGLTIEEVKLSEEYFTWKSREVANPDSQVYIFEISLRPDAPLGRLSQSMSIRTGIVDEQPVVITIRGEVVHHFRADPSLVNLGSFARGKDKEHVVVVRPLNNTKHKVESAQSTHPQILTRLEEQGDGSFKVFLDVDPNVVPGKIKARLLIRTTDPDEPILTIPIQGYVRGQG